MGWRGSPLVRWVVWLALLLSFVLVRPRASSLAFWLWAAAIVAVGLALMHRARVEATAEREAFAQWSSRLASLGALRDVEDDGHLYEWLDPPHWQDVFAALEAMPAHARSLRAALLATHPETLQ
jgi:hypothetical protein